jgi:hypothetical protein
MLEYQKEINWATSGVTGKSFRVGHGHEQRWMLRAALDEWQQAAAGQARQAGWGPGVAKPPSDPQSRPGPVRPSARYVTAPPPQAGAQTACDGVDRREMDSSGHNTRILNVFRGHPVAIRPRTPDRRYSHENLARCITRATDNRSDSNEIAFSKESSNPDRTAKPCSLGGERRPDPELRHSQGNARWTRYWAYTSYPFARGGRTTDYRILWKIEERPRSTAQVGDRRTSN